MTRRSRKKLIIVFTALLFLGVFFSVYRLTDSRPEENAKIRERVIERDTSPLSRNWEVERVEIEARAVYSVYYEDDKKRVLYSKNPDKELPIASISKLMTAYSVFKNYDLLKPLNISENQLVTDNNLRDLRIWPGETTYEDLFYSLLIESNNSTAYALAIAPENMTFESFVSKMNEEAQSLNLESTSFINPSGLDSSQGEANLSSGKDIHKLIRELLNYDIFWEIMQLPSYRLYSSSRSVYYEIHNTNVFLYNSFFSENPDWQNHMIGGKTGTTHKAGECLVIVLDIPEKGYIINVILDSNNRFKEMEKLNNWIYKAYNL